MKSAAVGQEEYDRAKGQCAEAEAALHTAEAALKTAQLRLDFTRIAAPFAGKIGDELDEEDLPTTTTIATAIMLRPIGYMSNSPARRSASALAAAPIGKNEPSTLLPLQFGLAGDTGYPYRGD